VSAIETIPIASIPGVFPLSHSFINTLSLSPYPSKTWRQQGAKSSIPKDQARGVQRSPPAASANFHSQLDYNSRMTKPPAKDPLVSLARYSEMGFVIPAAVLLGFFLGKLADYWLHTKWLYLVGLLFGAVVGFWQVIVMAMDAFKKDE
jgi:hypothetical protein